LKTCSMEIKNKTLAASVSSLFEKIKDKEVKKYLYYSQRDGTFNSVTLLAFASSKFRLYSSMTEDCEKMLWCGQMTTTNGETAYFRAYYYVTVARKIDLNHMGCLETLSIIISQNKSLVE
jgi:hypothetical protein